MNNDGRIVSNEYSEYLKVDLLPGSKAVEDSIDETLTRLEEYSSLIDMVRVDPSVEICRSLLKNKDELDNLFEKVRKLEVMVHRIKMDVDKVEEHVDNAEADLGISTEGKIRNILRPFFKRANTIPAPTQQRKHHKKFIAPEIFKTTDYFTSS